MLLQGHRDGLAVLTQRGLGIGSLIVTANGIQDVNLIVVGKDHCHSSALSATISFLTRNIIVVTSTLVSFHLTFGSLCDDGIILSSSIGCELCSGLETLQLNSSGSLLD